MSIKSLPWRPSSKESRRPPLCREGTRAQSMQQRHAHSHQDKRTSKVKGTQAGVGICTHNGAGFTKEGKLELGSHSQSPREKSLFPASMTRVLLTSPPSGPAYCSTTGALFARLPAQQVSISRAIFHGSPSRPTQTKSKRVYVRVLIAQRLSLLQPAICRKY